MSVEILDHIFEGLDYHVVEFPSFIYEYHPAMCVYSLATHGRYCANRVYLEQPSCITQSRSVAVLWEVPW